MSTIYAVSSGEYSDYGVDCLFSTQAAAEAYIAKSRQLREERQDFARTFDLRIEQFELDVPESEWVITSVTMSRDGQVLGTSQYVGSTGSGLLCFQTGGQTFIWNVATDDEKRAIKVANEKRLAILAGNLWGASAQDVYRAFPS